MAILRYTIEAAVIIIGILFSFYIEEIRSQNKNIEIKNELLSDLNTAIKNDLSQIEEVQKNIIESLELIAELQNDMSNSHNELSDRDALSKLISVNVSISFFPEDGIYTELISSGSFELISNKQLKNRLLDIYNHKNQRKLSMEDDIDFLVNDYIREIYTKFRIEMSYNTFDGEFYGAQVLEKYKFNEQYYLSNELHGYLSAQKISGFMYGRLLNDLKNSYEAILDLSEEEITIK